MIYLITGQPGHGKTLRGLELALQLRDEGREVVADGTPGLDYERCGFIKPEKSDDLRAWESYPDGTVFLIDECYRLFPNRSANSTVPPHVEPLARHRHRGFDFILVCQLGTQIDPFVRALVESHQHVRKKFGWLWAVLKTWDHFQPSPLKSDGSNRMYRLPRKIMRAKPPLYRSTTKDTTRKTFPWYFIAGPLVLAYIGYVFWKVSSGGLFGTPAEAAPAAATVVAIGQQPLASVGAAPVTAATAQPQRQEKHVETPEEYFAKFVPRKEAMPWSAPAYDGRRVVAEPRVFCVITSEGVDGNGDWHDGACRCKTEQSTVYQMPEKDCRNVAENGQPYNPFQREDRYEKRTAGRTRVADAETVGRADYSIDDASAHSESVLSTSQFTGYGGLSLSAGTPAPVGDFKMRE